METTVARELLEETGLQLQPGTLELFGLYSDPRRDQRRHTASAVYIARPVSLQGLRPGDDAKAAEVVSREALPSLGFAFDHRTIIMDYLNRRTGSLSPDEPADWARSTCTQKGR